MKKYTVDFDKNVSLDGVVIAPHLVEGLLNGLTEELNYQRAFIKDQKNYILMLTKDLALKRESLIRNSEKIKNLSDSIKKQLSDINSSAKLDRFFKSVINELK